MADDLQDHIHLSANAITEPPGAGQTWVVVRRQPDVETYHTLVRSLDGTPHYHVLGGDSATQFANFTYAIKLSGADRFADWAILKAMAAKAVYHIDSYHDHVASHADQDVLMFVDRLGYETNDPDPMQIEIMVPILLKDIHT